MTKHLQNLLQNVVFILSCYRRFIKKVFWCLHIKENIILNICLEIAESYGMQTCSLEVRKNNTSAIRFYQSNGFVFLSEQMDSFIMKRDLQMQKGKTDEKRRRKENSLYEGEL